MRALRLRSAQPVSIKVLRLQVEALWLSIAQPFLLSHPGVAPAGVERATFLWAAAVVGAYSFTLGDERYQVCIFD